MRSSFLLAALPVEKTLCVAYVPSAVTSCRGVADDDTFSSSVASPACFLISASTIGICTSESHQYIYKLKFQKRNGKFFNPG